MVGWSVGSQMLSVWQIWYSAGREETWKGGRDGYIYIIVVAWKSIERNCILSYTTDKDTSFPQYGTDRRLSPLTSSW